jgi:hypothetical protein
MPDDLISALEDILGEPFPDLRLPGPYSPAAAARQRAAVLLYLASAHEGCMARGETERARFAASIIHQTAQDTIPAPVRLIFLIFDVKRANPKASPQKIASGIVQAFTFFRPELTGLVREDLVAAAVELAGTDGRRKKGQGEAAFFKAIKSVFRGTSNGASWETIKTQFYREKLKNEQARRDLSRRLGLPDDDKGDW